MSPGNVGGAQKHQVWGGRSRDCGASLIQGSSPESDTKFRSWDGRMGPWERILKES